VPDPDIAVVADAADNCGVPTVTFVADQSDGNTCPETITRTYIVEDGCGNSIDVEQTITVHDTMAPDLTIWGDALPECTSPQGATITLTDYASATDNCTDPVPLTFEVDGNPIDDTYVFPFGTTIVDVTATDDCGNTDMSSFTVTVVAGMLSVDGGYFGRANHWVTIEISLQTECIDFQQVMFDLSYNPGVLEYIDWSAQAIGDRIAGGTAAIETYCDDVNGIVKVAILSPGGALAVTGAPDLEYGDKLLSLTFRVNASADNTQDSDLALDEVHTAAMDGTLVELNLDDGNFWVDDCFGYLDIDQTGDVEGATDGLYLYRAMLHAVNALIPIVPPATRAALDPFIPDEAEMARYFDWLVAMSFLDADGDTRVLASKDGVYIYRYLVFDGLATVPAAHTANAGVVNGIIEAWLDPEECLVPSPIELWEP
jgi:hypothetical protein